MIRCKRSIVYGTIRNGIRHNIHIYILKLECRHFDEIFFIGTGRCQHDNFRSSQWRMCHTYALALELRLFWIDLSIMIYDYAVSVHYIERRPFEYKYTVLLLKKFPYPIIKMRGRLVCITEICTYLMETPTHRKMVYILKHPPRFEHRGFGEKKFISQLTFCRWHAYPAYEWMAVNDEHKM